jgi:uncharacterized protein
MVDIQLLRKIVKEKLENLEGSHSFDHTERVYEKANIITKQEGGDIQMVQVASLLHDIGRSIGEPHNETGIEPAKELLSMIDYPSEKRDKILYIIKNHRVSEKHNLRSLEGKIIWDADKLDIIGATGIARAFHQAGQMGTSITKVVKWCRDRSIDNPLTFHTKTAKEIAEKRYTIMKSFAESLEQEISIHNKQNT